MRKGEIEMLLFVLVAGWTLSRVMAKRRKSPHALWPLVVTMILVLGQVYGYPLFLVYWGDPTMAVILAWTIVVFAIVAVAIAMLYAWTCSITREVPTIAGYRRFAVAHAAHWRQTRRNDL